MYILSRNEMYKYDKYTIEEIGIPGRELMENAGNGCCERIGNDFLSHNDKIVLFCGSGNNGGDGFVIARILRKKGFYPTIILVGKIDKMSPETRSNYELCEKLDIEIHSIFNRDEWQNFDLDLDYFSLIIDAVFGVGFKGEVKGWIKYIFQEINKSRTRVVAIDIASGIDADTGQAGDAVKADRTYTMAAYKYGHFLGRGREKSGFIEIIDIGIPESVFRKFPPQAVLTTKKNIKYPGRSRYAHKGDFGKVGIIAGSPGFSGAAIMSAKAALRAGAGLITLFYPSNLGLDIVFESQLLEVMTYAIPEYENGNIEYHNFFEKLNQMDVLLIGPGIGKTMKTAELMKKILEHWKKPMVIDADAINIIAENEQLLDMLSEKPFILTPHIGEFARISQRNIQDILDDSITELLTFTSKYKCRVLLKSATTIFSDGKNLAFEISGNDGLATGGSGDVLAGIIVSFLAQKLAFQDAAVSASFLLGKTAEKLAEVRKPASIIPSDIIENIFKY